jgi:hypothetical protein
MRAHIVCYEQPPSWILGKIAHKLCDSLKAFNIDSSISDQPDFDADVNHHVYYLPFQGKKTKLDTLLVTHIDMEDKLKILLGQLKVADGAVFFSEQTKILLETAGAPPQKLTVINPPQDEVIRPRKLRVGLLTNIYPNNRKREDLIYELVKSLNLSSFKFEIMGTGWETLTGLLDQKGVAYTCYPEFDFECYIKLVPELDYYLYTGNDEGSMAFLDAMSADVKTIVTPQGFHLDTNHPIDHPFETADDLKDVFIQIIAERRARPNAVTSWTWPNYASSHVVFWHSLINNGA